MKALLSIILAILVAAGCKNKTPNPAYKTDLTPIETLPDIQFQLLDSTKIALDSKLPKNRVLLLYYFDPDCPHCKEQTVMMLNSKMVTETSYIAFLSKAELSDIKQYDSIFKITSRSNTVVGKDYEYSFLKYLNKGALPLLAIYDIKKKLKIIFVGSVDEELLNKYIKSAI